MRFVRTVIQTIKATLKRRRKGYEIVGHNGTLAVRRLR